MSVDDLATFFLQNEKKKLGVIFNSVFYPKKKKKKKKRKQADRKSSLVRICQMGVLHSCCQISTSNSIKLINRVRLV